MNPYAVPMPTAPGNLGHSEQGSGHVHPTWKQLSYPEAKGGEATALFASHKRGGRKQALNHGHYPNRTKCCC